MNMWKLKKKILTTLEISQIYGITILDLTRIYGKSQCGNLILANRAHSLPDW